MPKASKSANVNKSKSDQISNKNAKRSGEKNPSQAKKKKQKTSNEEEEEDLHTNLGPLSEDEKLAAAKVWAVKKRILDKPKCSKSNRSKCWKKIVGGMHSVTTKKRSYDDGKTRFRNFMKNTLTKGSKKSLHKTGGGKAVKFTEAEEIVINAEKNSVKVTGIPGIDETGLPDSDSDEENGSQSPVLCGIPQGSQYVDREMDNAEFYPQQQPQHYQAPITDIGNNVVPDSTLQQAFDSLERMGEMGQPVAQIVSSFNSGPNSGNYEDISTNAIPVQQAVLPTESARTNNPQQAVHMSQHPMFQNDPDMTQDVNMEGLHCSMTEDPNRLSQQQVPGITGSNNCQRQFAGSSCNTTAAVTPQLFADIMEQIEMISEEEATSVIEATAASNVAVKQRILKKGLCNVVEVTPGGVYFYELVKHVPDIIAAIINTKPSYVHESFPERDEYIAIMCEKLACDLSWSDELLSLFNKEAQANEAIFEFLKRKPTKVIRAKNTKTMKGKGKGKGKAVSAADLAPQIQTGKQTQNTSQNQQTQRSQQLTAANASTSKRNQQSKRSQQLPTENASTSERVDNEQRSVHQQSINDDIPPSPTEQQDGQGDFNVSSAEESGDENVDNNENEDFDDVLGSELSDNDVEQEEGNDENAPPRAMPEGTGTSAAGGTRYWCETSLRKQQSGYLEVDTKRAKMQSALMQKQSKMMDWQKEFEIKKYEDEKIRLDEKHKAEMEIFALQKRKLLMDLGEG